MNDDMRGIRMGLVEMPWTARRHQLSRLRGWPELSKRKHCKYDMRFPPTRYINDNICTPYMHLPMYLGIAETTPALEPPLCDPLSDRRPSKVLVYNPGLSLSEHSILSFPFSITLFPQVLRNTLIHTKE
jgi:hypothetical protein